MRDEQIITENDQYIQKILEENNDELVEFLDDQSCEHHKAKALISFALATYYALKLIEKERK